MLKKKSFTVIGGAKHFLLQRFEKKLLPQLNHAYTPPPQTSNGYVNHLGGGGRNGFKCHPSTKWLARFHHVVVFKTNKVLHFKIEKTPMKDTDGKRNSMEYSVSFLWTNESFSL